MFMHQMMNANRRIMMQQRQQMLSLNQKMIMARYFASKNSNPANPHVFFEISQDSKDIGRIEFELYMD